MITDAYRVVMRHGHSVLLCLLCLRWSYHPKDIEARFCAGCGVFLATIPRTLEGPREGEDPRAWVVRQEHANWQGERTRALRYREERIVSPLLTSEGHAGT